MTRLEIYAILALVLAFAIGGAYLKGHHSGYVEGKQEVQAEFDKFKNEVTAAGLKAKQDALDKEKNDAQRVATAQSERDIAIGRMRAAEAAASAARRAMPLTPAAAAGNSLICFDQKALSAAVERYRGRVRSLVESGDETAIDAAALIKAWPTDAKAIAPMK